MSSNTSDVPNLTVNTTSPSTSSSSSSSSPPSQSPTSPSLSDVDADVPNNLPVVPDGDYSPLAERDPEEDYIFGEPLKGESLITLASNITVQQILQPVERKILHPSSSSSSSSTTTAETNKPPTTLFFPFQLYAKSYFIEKEYEMRAIMLYIRTWYGIDRLDRPGCGKIIQGYLSTHNVTVVTTDSNGIKQNTASTSPSSLPSESTDQNTTAIRTLPRITLIFEGSPRLHVPLRKHFEKYYTYFPDMVVGRGGNTGLDLSNQGITPYGGLYRGQAIDFTKPLPSLVIKRIDGRDLLFFPEHSRPVKNINNTLGTTRLQEEINTWASVHYPSPHPRVIRIFDAFLDSANVEGCNVASIVMETAPEGTIDNPHPPTPDDIAYAFSTGTAPPPLRVSRPSDLLEILMNHGPVNIYVAVHIMSQIFTTLFHLHNRFPQIIHRDIKADNIIIWDVIEHTTLFIMNETTKEEVRVYGPLDLYVIKLADFGDARFVDPTNTATTNIGTPAYKAPEVGENKPQTPAVDVYMCGVTLYTLLVGDAPFGTTPGQHNMNHDLWSKKLKEGANALPDSQWNSYFTAIDPEGQNVVQRMMHPDPRKRITIPELFNHPLFSICRKIYHKVRNKKVPLVPTWDIEE